MKILIASYEHKTGKSAADINGEIECRFAFDLAQDALIPIMGNTARNRTRPTAQLKLATVVKNMRRKGEQHII